MAGPGVQRDLFDRADRGRIPLHVADGRRMGGGDLINPADGTANMLGPAVANAKSTGTEQWGNTGCPLFAPDDFQSIDDTKTAPTWYCVGTSGGKPVILQVSYTGSYNTNRVFNDGEAIGTGKPQPATITASRFRMPPLRT